MAEKLEMISSNVIQENIDYIAEKFPSALKEVLENGKLVKKIDFDILKQELSTVVIDDKQERYQMTWPDKKKSILLANSRVNATLRPVKEKSIDFDNTQNLYIEGDNLDVLKLLRETYLGEIKMIYVDPPYNTGKDFVYEDDFSQAYETYIGNSGQFDDKGNRMVQNIESNGRFHTDWINMLYPRLKIAKDLLKEDGIIFISIDDNEVGNLRKVCDEIFLSKNFVAQIIIDGTPKNDPKIISTSHEYCLVYVKNFDIAKECEWGVANPVYDQLLQIVRDTKDIKAAELKVKKFYKDNNLDDDNIANYNKIDERGLYRIGPIDDPQSGGSRDTRYNPRTGEALKTPNSGWRCSIKTWELWVKNGEVLFPEDNSKLCSRKIYIEKGKLDLLRSYFKMQTRKDTDMLKTYFDGKKVFSFPKPVELIKTFIDSSIKTDDIVLDFFSGSGTTAHATLLFNRDRMLENSNYNAKYILVQIQESLYENLKYASGNREKMTCQNAIDYCEQHKLEPYLTSIGIERIKKASNEIISQEPLLLRKLDIGFRVFKLDSSNMNDVYYNPNKLNQNMLDQLVGNVKEDRTPIDLLFQVMLELGVKLSAKIEEKELLGKKYFVVNENDIVACFDDGINDELVKELAKIHSIFAVFKDSAFASDSANINCEQIFKSISPSTTIKVV
jgi:adenine-specific DNA-methyltransferase